MRPRFAIYLLTLALVCAVPACKSPEEKKPVAEGKKTPKEKAKEQKEREKHSIPDASGDTNFQSFLGRLRLAIGKKDKATLSSLMSNDFGWRWENPQPGTPFDYWDQTNAWGELEQLASQRFVPSGIYMVSPIAFALDSEYRGYRMGLRQINGAWRFAYFVTGEDVLQ